MQPKNIGIKQLHRDLSKVVKAAERGGSFVVFRHTRPVFRIEPVEPRQGRYTLADLKTIRFSAKNKKLSHEVDRIVW